MDILIYCDIRYTYINKKYSKNKINYYFSVKDGEREKKKIDLSISIQFNLLPDSENGKIT